VAPEAGLEPATRRIFRSCASYNGWGYDKPMAGILVKIITCLCELTSR
jgi:hypothetical protein